MLTDFTGRLTTQMARSLCGIIYLRSSKKCDVTRQACTKENAHDIYLKNLTMRSVIGTDQWRRHTWLDRPDLQYTTSVLMRTLETPLKLQEMQLMRLASYMNAMLELRRDFQYQEKPDEVHVEVGNDWAQCPRKRWSTRGGLVFWSKSTCQQQHTISHDVAQLR